MFTKKRQKLYLLIAAILLINSILYTAPAAEEDSIVLSAEERERILSWSETEGLDPEELEDIGNSQYIIYERDDQKGMFALILLKSDIESSWEIIAAPEKLDTILTKNLKESRLVTERPERKDVYFLLSAGPFNIYYTVIHHINPEEHRITWALDEEAENKVLEFDGYWKLYPLRENLTAGCYWAFYNFSDSVPRRIERRLLRSNLPHTMESLKEAFKEK